jgi:hypothetical protein
MALTVTFTFWRAPAFLIEFFSARGSEAIAKRRLLTLMHFLNLVVDLPFIFLALLVSCSLYR